MLHWILGCRLCGGTTISTLLIEFEFLQYHLYITITMIILQNNIILDIDQRLAPLIRYIAILHSHQAQERRMVLPYVRIDLELKATVP
jgi:hypothetical protein